MSQVNVEVSCKLTIHHKKYDAIHMRAQVPLEEATAREHSVNYQPRLLFWS